MGTTTTRSTAAPELDSALLAPGERVESFLASYLDDCALPANLDEAVRYALLTGGKRLRPILAAHCCAAVGGGPDDWLPAGASVEMIHAFSLIHDDLPALDDDDLRRGRPTLHRAHGEAMAILAGDVLMSLAFQVLVERTPEPALAARLVREIGLGTTSMIAGQVYDTLGGFAPGLSERDRLRLVHDNKTGALITAACRMGAIGARGNGAGDESKLEAVTRYGACIGLMFQIVDDLLDVEQTTEHLGKRASKDVDAGKLTYPGLVGIDASRREIDRLLASALEATRVLGEGGQGPDVEAGGGGAALARIAEFMAVRTK